MCGIIGIFGSEATKTLDLGTISHRGPDGSSMWRSSEHEPECVLGHTRLSILDTSELASQPMLSEDGRYVLVYNGEIYNFIELRRELTKKFGDFRSESDTEVFFKGLILEGPSFLLRCNGMWAFCLWDRKERTALFGRDRFGEKPLYYASIGSSSFMFCSEMKGIYKYLRKVTPSDDIEAIFENIFDYESTENCVVEGIKRFPPGTYAYFKEGRITVSRWWNTLDNLRSPPESYEEQVELWRDTFLDAVKIRMRSDVPIGTALSGGLDSSAVFCSMAYLENGGKLPERASSNWKNAFCAHFPGSSLDEVEWANQVAEFTQVTLNKVEIDPHNCGWDLLGALYAVEDPYMTLPFPMLATYKAISQSGVKVTLDGHGCDELFSGYGHLNAAFQGASPIQLVELKAIQASMFSGVYKESSFPRILYLLEKFKKISKPLRYLLQKTISNKDIRSKLSNLQGGFRRNDLVHEVFKSFDPLTKELYVLYHYSVLPTLLRNYDRYSMASGVEIRMPFTDHRLVTLTFALPWTSKVGGGYTKRIMRDALKGIMPDNVRLRRSKIGWNAPIHDCFKEYFCSQIEELILKVPVSSDVRTQLQNFRDLESTTFNDGQKLWEVMLPYFWRVALLRGVNA
jgi:asparagine synthase (glutamine-hydrolysing)